MERLWLQLAPRKQASKIAGVVVDMVRPDASWCSRTLCFATRSTSCDAAASARSSTSSIG